MKENVCPICSKTHLTSRNRKCCSRQCSNKDKYTRNKPWYNTRSRANRLKRDYGITPDDYNRMFTIQNGNCAICHKNQSEFDKALAVDHNHTTGTVRGLLCQYCNTALGLMSDDTNRLLEAANYLSRN